MKFKFLSILMAIAVALAFTSCENKSGSSSSDSSKSDTSSSEQVDENGEPTGDIEKDAKTISDKTMELLKDTKTEEDINKAKEESEKIFQEYLKYYKEKGGDELGRKFENACETEMEERIEPFLYEHMEKLGILIKNEASKDTE